MPACRAALFVPACLRLVYTILYLTLVRRTINYPGDSPVANGSKGLGPALVLDIPTLAVIVSEYLTRSAKGMHTVGDGLPYA